MPPLESFFRNSTLNVAFESNISNVCATLSKDYKRCVLKHTAEGYSGVIFLYYGIMTCVYVCYAPPLIGGGIKR